MVKTHKQKNIYSNLLQFADPQLSILCRNDGAAINGVVVMSVLRIVLINLLTQFMFCKHSLLRILFLLCNSNLFTLFPDLLSLGHAYIYDTNPNCETKVYFTDLDSGISMLLVDMTPQDFCRAARVS